MCQRAQKTGGKQNEKKQGSEYEDRFQWKWMVLGKEQNLGVA